MSSVDLAAAARRHPRFGDSVIAAVVAGACAIILTGRTGATVTHTTPFDRVWIVVLAAPLIWRRRAPVIVFWTVAVLSWVSLGTGIQSPAGVLVPLTALHAVARYRPPAWSIPAICFLVPPGFAVRIDKAHSWAAIMTLAAISATVIFIGISQRTRQAYLAALEDRAERLERDRDQQSRLAVAEERTRIAREMHDVVAHHLTVMTALSEGAAATVPADPSRAAGVMTQVSATGREALAEMRRLVGVLRSPSDTATPPGPTVAGGPPPASDTSTPPGPTLASGQPPASDTSTPPGSMLAGGPHAGDFGGGERRRFGGGAQGEQAASPPEPAGSKPSGPHPADPQAPELQPADPAAVELLPQPGLDDLDALVEGVRAAGLRVTVTREGTPGPWGPGAGLALYRIVQEALTNTLKHAGPQARAEVGLRFAAPSAELDIRDDGAGRVASRTERAETAETAGCHGITGMVERAAAYGGEVTAGPRADRAGWQVHARFHFDDSTSGR
jgi:signal transduction histidine kinase